MPKTIKKITSIIFDSVSKLRGGTELLGECERLGSGIVSIKIGSDISFYLSRLGLEVGICSPSGTYTARDKFLYELELDNNVEKQFNWTNAHDMILMKWLYPSTMML